MSVNLSNLNLPDLLKVGGSNVADNWRRFKELFGNYELTSRFDRCQSGEARDCLPDMYWIRSLWRISGNGVGTDGDRRKLDSIVTAFNTLCMGNVNVTYKRYVFVRCIQDSGERFAVFLGKLWRWPDPATSAPSNNLKMTEMSALVTKTTEWCCCWLCADDSREPLCLSVAITHASSQQPDKSTTAVSTSEAAYQKCRHFAAQWNEFCICVGDIGLPVWLIQVIKTNDQRSYCTITDNILPCGTPISWSK